MTTETEPCPHCQGTGRRPVAPPPMPRGGRLGPQSGRTHGLIATYSWGCRCELCRAANRQYKRGRK